jgi:hypothetical protein
MKMSNAATVTESTPKKRNSSLVNNDCRVMSVTPLKRKIARKATLSSTLERSAAIGVGALEYVSGFQVWSGTKPILVPYPTKTKIKAIWTISGCMEAAPSRSVCHVSVSADRAGNAKKRRVPRRLRRSPSELIMRYFHAASVADFLL